MVGLNIDDQFVRRILMCISGKRQTPNEIQVEYQRVYPSGRIIIAGTTFLKKIQGKTSQEGVTTKVQNTIEFLEKEKYIVRELTSFTDRPHLDGIMVYYVTKKRSRGTIFKEKITP